jgi:3-oxoacyl-[acyl-carrier protein] reductase
MQPGQAENVLVVGASSPIGMAVANRFADSGMQVQATYCRAARPTDTGAISWHSLDVTDEEEIRQFASRFQQAGQGLDVVVLVAGFLAGKQLSDYGFSDVDKTMDINFSGPVKLLASLLPGLRDGSRVIMFASVSGERGSYDPVYAASKGAVIAFVKSMAVRLAPRTRFVAVAPGLVEGSSMFDEMAPERRDFHRKATPLGRLIEPSEMANIVFDLTRPHWAHANGSCVRINGGSYV